MATSNAKARGLTLRAVDAAHLCFPIDGILEEMDTQLGATIGTGTAAPIAFTLALSQLFYNNLDQRATGGDDSLLKFDSINIYNSLSNYRLAALRAAQVKAALDGAVKGRQNSYYKKYASSKQISAQMNQYSNTASSTASVYYKANCLKQLLSNTQSQYTQLAAAYGASTSLQAAGGIVTSTTNTTNVTGGTIVTLTEMQTNTNPGADIWTIEGSSPVQTSPAATVTNSVQFGIWEGYNWVPLPQGRIVEPSQTITYAAPTSSKLTNTQTTTTTNVDYNYRIPATEVQSRNARAQISLNDEAFSAFLFGIQVPYVDAILSNELTVIDLGVKRLQSAYIDTILMSPIAGIVTGVFKNVGERVRAGEPVLRVEDPNGRAWLVGTLVYDGPKPISVTTAAGPGSNVLINTTLYGAAAEITGNVVAVRGNRAEANHYDVVIYCTQFQGFPFNYHFDSDNTSVTIS